MRRTFDIKMQPLVEGEGDLFTIEEFINMVNTSCIIIGYDGSGHYVKDNMRTVYYIDENLAEINNFTHILWYNK